MALTDEEKKLARAYNIGYSLSAHEPQLLAKIIKANPKNEFVKGMKIGRDHHEFYANIPRNDYTAEFKNGFYNGRALVEHDQVTFDRLMKNPAGLSKDYIEGLKSAQKEFTVRAIHEKLAKTPKAPTADLRADVSFQKGFNTGYRLSERYSHALKYSETMNEKYSKFIEGVKTGKQQYQHDVAQLREKNPNAQIFKDDPETRQYRDALIEHKLTQLNDLSNSQHRAIEKSEGLTDVKLPDWLRDTERFENRNNAEKEKDNDYDLDR